VKFVVDAQLLAKLSRLLAEAGHDSVHTSLLPRGNRTTDATLAGLVDDEDRLVITKDRAFRNSHLLRRSPRRLLTVSAGNVANAELLALFADNLGTVVDALSEADFVELGPRGLIVHRDRT
jgi:predicted nuclease of predicted toxin-antitoxin system